MHNSEDTKRHLHVPGSSNLLIINVNINKYQYLCGTLRDSKDETSSVEMKTVHTHSKCYHHHHQQTKSVKTRSK